VSQPCNKQCDVEAPGEVDASLNEFWSGKPWKIYEENNLSCFERNRTYLNLAGKDFIEVSHLTGADDDGDSRGIIAVDLRQTGQLDLVLRQVGGGPLKIFENRLPARRYLTVSLRGSKSNRLGLGARLTAQTGSLSQVREMYPANSFVTQLPSVVYFGLGDAAKVDRLTVRWPSGLEQEFTDVPTNQHVVLSEGVPHIETVEPGRTIVP
jgi:hypothetical protein